MCWWRCTALWLSKMHVKELLMLCCGTFVGGVSDIVSIIFTHKDSHNFDYWLMSMHNPLIIQVTRQKSMMLHRPPYVGDSSDVVGRNCWHSIDAYIKYILTVIIQSSIVCYKSYSHMDNQYSVSMYNYLHSEASWPHNVWSATIHSIRVIDDIALSHSCAFGRQFTACRSIQ